MAVTAIRIADPHLLKAIEAEQKKTGEGTPTKTAQRLITERLAQLELRDQQLSPSMVQTPAA